jgi:hypothetical protein
MTAPRYQDLAGDAVPVRREPGVEVRVYSGASGGVTAPTKNFVPVTMVEIRLDLGASVDRNLSADYNALIVILEGEGAIGAEGKSVTAGDVAGLTRGDNRKAGASPIPGLSTTRIRRPDPNATSKRRSQLSALSWRAASQDACRAALVANALTYDTVRLAGR